MSIDFDKDRWEIVKKNYSRFWDKTLDRPLIPVILYGKEPNRPKPNIPLLTQANCHDLSVPAKDIIDRIDYELSKFTYLGDSFPYFNMDCFGPGVVAAFLGAKLDNSSGRVWFYPNEIIPIKDLHFEFDGENVWFNRIIEIYEAGMKYWQGKVIMGMPDLGGILDILAIFRTSENLLIDFYDEPDEVKRLTMEIHNLWLQYYNKFNEVLQPVNPGYTDWSIIYSDKPSYIPQSDISYMISTDMFDNFARPQLELLSKTLPRTIYHMDGIGQLNHIDSILSIEELDAVQWVPGAGKPKQDKWPEVLKKILASAKNTQLLDGLTCLENVVKDIGIKKGIHNTPIFDNISQKDDYIRELSKYGIY